MNLMVRITSLIMRNPARTVIPQITCYSTFNVEFQQDSRIQNIRNHLGGIGFTNQQCEQIVLREPRVIALPKKSISSKFTFLKMYLSQGETLKCILNSPQVLLEREDIVKLKLEYLIKHCSHETANIVSGSVMSHDLKRMACRHEFLICAGLFKPIPYRKIIKVLEKERGANMKRQKYFTPSDVVCTSDKSFLKICTNNVFSVNDLAVFEGMFYSQFLHNYENELRHSQSSASNMKEDDGKEVVDVEEVLMDYKPFEKSRTYVEENNSRSYCTATEAIEYYY